MAHMIEGNRAFFLKQKPWHNVGKILDQEYTDIVDAVMSVLPEAYSKEVPYLKRVDGSYRPVKDYRIIMRSNDTEIGAVQDSFELLQPTEIVKPWQAFLDTKACTLDCMGVLKNGKQIFCTFKINNATAAITPNDIIESYLIVASGFEGSLPYIALTSNTRVVCNNTLEVAIVNGGSNSYRLRHTKNVRGRVIDATKAIALAMSNFTAGVETYKALAAKKMTPQQMVDYINNIFISDELKAKLKEENKEISHQLSTKINRVIDLLTEQQGIDVIQHGTVWQAYSAVTEYLTHEQGRTDESRLYNQWFGPVVTLSNRALALATAAIV